jgi:hypothetical protein
MVSPDFASEKDWFSSGLLRKKDVFSEEDPKVFRRTPEEKSSVYFR